MPRANPVTSRRKMAVSHIVSGNNTIRAVAVTLRWSATDAVGNERPFTIEDVDQCIAWMNRAINQYDTALTALEYLKKHMEES